MNCVSCDICVHHLGLLCFFPRVFLSSRVTGACPVTTDLIMRVFVRTTTTTRAWKDYHVHIARGTYHYAYARQTQVHWKEETIPWPQDLLHRGSLFIFLKLQLLGGERELLKRTMVVRMRASQQQIAHRRSIRHTCSHKSYLSTTRVGTARET